MVLHIATDKIIYHEALIHGSTIVGGNHKTTPHTYYMKSGTSILFRNHQAYVQETQDKTSKAQRQEEANNSHVK